MWRDRILEAKKDRGVRTKDMAEFALMTEKSVARILSGDTQNPYVDNVIILGAAVGLTPSEIFSETGLVVGGQDLATLQAEVDRLTAELQAVTAEAVTLRSEASTLATENATLRLKLEHKDELVKHKDEIIALLRQTSTHKTEV